MPEVEMNWCRWDPKQRLRKSKKKKKGRAYTGCKQTLLGKYANIDEAQDDGWDVFLYQSSKAARVGIKLPANFGGGLVSADAPDNGPIQITFKTCCVPFTVEFGASQCQCGSAGLTDFLLLGRAYAVPQCTTCGGVRVCGSDPACH